MGGARGQFWTPRPLARAWGSAKEFRPGNPAAGASAKQELQGGFLWRLLMLRVELTTVAEAAERWLRLEWQDGDGKARLCVVFPTVQPESKTWEYNAALDIDSESAEGGARQTVALPDIVVPAGWELVVAVGGIKATDQLKNLRMRWEQFEKLDDHEWSKAWEIAETLARVKELLEYGQAI